MICPQCGAEHPEEQGRFCSSCGLPIVEPAPMTCPHCGATYGPEQGRFCDACGLSVASATLHLEAAERSVARAAARPDDEQPRCRACGTRTSAATCPGCGTRMPPPDE